MRKILLLMIAIFAFAFDIDDLDRGYHALRNSEYKAAFEIFYEGCEADDTLACEELGYMYINGEISKEIDGRMAELKGEQLGLRYLVKSCFLGYLNGCGSVLQLAKQMQIDTKILESAKLKYDQLAFEFENDLNSTMSEQNSTKF